jgi:hypothetical protein
VTGTPGGRNGFACQDCGEIRWLNQGLLHVRWLRDREHVAREVAQHSSSGLETWMDEGLAFLEEHRGHDVVVISE